LGAAAGAPRELTNGIVSIVSPCQRQRTRHC